jgi:beta-lactamase class D
MNKYFILYIFFPFSAIFSLEENFIVIDASTNTVLVEMGPHINERISPCSTFKIALSLMGFEAEILEDAQNPIWDFQEGYDDFLEKWKSPQTPQTWMRYSCVWYSRILASLLGAEVMENYLHAFAYGNGDLSSGHTGAWLRGSLKISPKEQVHFIQNMIKKTLLISQKSFDKTKEIVFLENLQNGWKLFGKTGWGGASQDHDALEMAWVVGWMEKEDTFLPFAYNIRAKQIKLSQRIPRVKELLANIMEGEPISAAEF